MRQDHTPSSTPVAPAAPTQGDGPTPELARQGRAERALAMVAGACMGIIVIGTTVLMMPTPAMAAGPAAQARVAHPSDGDEVPALRLQRFALNALVVPVIDDTVPARWTRNIAAMRCGKASRLLVDGKPVKPSAEVPSRPFTVSWTLVDCQPLGPTESFNGKVTLTVFPENDGWSAMVVPSALKVVAHDSSAVWSRPFSVGLPAQP